MKFWKYGNVFLGVLFFTVAYTSTLAAAPVTFEVFGTIVRETPSTRLDLPIDSEFKLSVTYDPTSSSDLNQDSNVGVYDGVSFNFTSAGNEIRSDDARLILRTFDGRRAFGEPALELDAFRTFTGSVGALLPTALNLALTSNEVSVMPDDTLPDLATLLAQNFLFQNSALVRLDLNNGHFVLAAPEGISGSAVAAVPLPSSLLFLGTVLCGLLSINRKSKVR